MARDKKNATPLQLWFEEAWEGWIRPLGAIVLLAIGYLLYKFDIISERPAGVLLILVIVLGSVGTGLFAALPLALKPWQRALTFTAVGLAALAALYPTLHSALPGARLAEGALTVEKPALTLTTGRSGPYELTVSGHFKEAGRADAEAGYDLTVKDNGGGSDEVQGEIKRQQVTIRSRKGSSTSIQERNESTHRLGHVRGPTVTLSSDGVDEQLDGGLQVALHPAGLPPVLFIVLGALAIAMALVLDTRLVDLKGKQKSYLTATTAIAYAFALRYPEYATSQHLVGPAISEFLFALVVGGLGGWLLGGIGRVLFGPKIKKTAPSRR